MLKEAVRFAFPFVAASLLAACGGGRNASTLPPVGSSLANDAINRAQSIGSSAYQATVMGDAPLAYYRLDDTTPVAADSSGHNLAGAYGAGVRHGAASLLTSDPDAAATFPGGAWNAANFVRVPANKTLEPANAVSVECWVKTGAISDNAALVSYGDNVNDPRQPYALKTDSQTNLFLFAVVVNGVQQIVYAKTALTVGKTFHVVGTYDGNTLGVYVNGVLEGTTAAAGSITHYDLSNGLGIGARYLNASNVYNGTIDEVAVYGGALSAARVAAHYAAGIAAAPTPPPSPTSPRAATYAATVKGDKPLAFYPLADAAPGTLSDVSGNGQNGKYGGGTAASSTIALHVPGILTNDTGFAAGFGGSPWATPGIAWGPQNSATLKPTAGVSVEAWVSSAGPIVPGGAIVSYGDNLNDPRQPYALIVDASGANDFLFAVAVNGTQQIVTSKTQMQTGKAYHIVGTFDGSNLRIYVNGGLESALNAPGTIGHYDGANGLAIGARYENNGVTPVFNGSIEDVAIYGGALSAAQIASHYAAGTTIAPPPPTPTPSPSPAPSPSPSPTSGCAGPPSLVNGIEFSANWAPYNCKTSALNVPVSSNPTFASYSSQAIAAMFGSGNTQPVRDQESGPYDYGHPIYFASASDPVVNIVCTNYCNHTDNGGYPASMRLPAKAQPAGGSDAHLAVIQPDGTEIDFWASQRTASTVTAQAVANCGSFYSGSGFTPTGPAATAGGACLGAGNLRANELLAGHIPHALFLVSQCAVGWQYPAFPGASTQQCTSGVGAPLGARLWYDVPCATTQGSGLMPWEKAILCALNQYGGYLMDNISGGPSQSGILFLAESGEPAYDYGLPDPFAALTAQGWSGISIGGAHQLRYVGSDPWVPGGVDFRSHMHWLAPCSAQGSC